MCLSRHRVDSSHRWAHSRSLGPSRGSHRGGRSRISEWEVIKRQPQEIFLPFSVSAALHCSHPSNNAPFDCIFSQLPTTIVHLIVGPLVLVLDRRSHRHCSGCWIEGCESCSTCAQDSQKARHEPRARSSKGASPSRTWRQSNTRASNREGIAISASSIQSEVSSMMELLTV